MGSQGYQGGKTVKRQKFALWNQIARDEARMRALREGIENLKARMGETGK